MSNCELTLAFDRPDLTYHFGDTVTGAVHVRVASKGYCRLLTLEWEWRTHGLGNPESEMDNPLPVYAGEWEQGQVYRYPFKFRAPNGPETYHGHYLNVDWYVRARANFPHASAHGTEREILVVRGSHEEAAVGASPKQATRNHNTYLGPTYRSPGASQVSEKMSPSNRTLLRGILILMCGLVMVAVGAAPLFRLGQLWHDGWSLLCLIPLGGLVAAIGASEISRGFRLRGFGDLTLKIDPVVAKPGAYVTCQVVVHPSSAELVPCVSFTLSAIEVVVTGAGSDMKEHTRVLYGNTMQPVLHSEGTGGFSYEARFTVPEHAPATFSSQWNKLEWLVTLRLTAQATPEYHRSYPLTVCS